MSAREAAGDRSARFRPFRGRIVFRQVPEQAAAALWQPTVQPYRWSRGFPALYTSLDLDVAFAERVKRTGSRPTRLVVGVALASITRAVDLPSPASLATFGATVEDVTSPDYSVSQQIGRELLDAGAAALLVPAAIAEVPRQHPRFAVVRSGRREERDTPGAGVNLVIFTANLRRGDGYPEIERFICEVVGLGV